MRLEKLSCCATAAVSNQQIDNSVVLTGSVVNANQHAPVVRIANTKL